MNKINKFVSSAFFYYFAILNSFTALHAVELAIKISEMICVFGFELLKQHFFLVFYIVGDDTWELTPQNYTHSILYRKTAWKLAFCIAKLHFFVSRHYKKSTLLIIIVL